jgi:hypothetical protein
VILKLLVILCVPGAGLLLSRSRLQINKPLMLLTVAGAALLHAVVRDLLNHQAIERYATDDLNSASMAITSLAETIGLWLPLFVLPWADLLARSAVTLSVIAGAFWAAGAFYMPFDVVIINGEIVGPTHPVYEIGVLLAFVCSAVVFATAKWIESRFKKAQ